MPSVDEAAAEAAARKAFEAAPLAFEEPEVEWARLERWKRDDPIALQDALNTSQALVQAVKDADAGEVRAVVANAEPGEIMQAFVLQAAALALRSASLELVRLLASLGAPLGHDELQEAVHLVCEVTSRDNFSDAWRIVQFLIQDLQENRHDINRPRIRDGWTPLCIACADACLPLAFKLLELDADPNTITRASETPLAIVRRRLEGDTEEQREARGIISNMLRSYGGQERWQDALHASKPRPGPRPSRAAGAPEQVVTCEDGSTCVTQAVSKTHTRFSA